MKEKIIDKYTNLPISRQRKYQLRHREYQKQARKKYEKKRYEQNREWVQAYRSQRRIQIQLGIWKFSPQHNKPKYD